MLEMARKQLIPAACKFAGDMAAAMNAKQAAFPGLRCKAESKILQTVSAQTDAMSDAADALSAEVAKADNTSGSMERAQLYHSHVIPAMDALRAAADAAELLCGRSYWPLPTYSKILYYV